MTYKHSGSCCCENVVFSIALPDPLEAYSPWCCDCDFCTARNASYLSHPDGSLNIESAEPLDVIHQGSKQAAFLACASCGTLVAVAYPFAENLKGAVNATLLTDSQRLNEPRVVSPKRLRPDEKLNNWQRLWLNLRINGDDRLQPYD